MSNEIIIAECLECGAKHEVYAETRTTRLPGRGFIASFGTPLCAQPHGPPNTTLWSGEDGGKPPTSGFYAGAGDAAAAYSPMDVREHWLKCTILIDGKPIE